MPADRNPRQLWAKVDHDLRGNVTGWHSLIDHSADVAACFEAVLACPTPRSRLARLAGRTELPDLWSARLSALAALHDFGKANTGFQARWSVRAPFVGHCREAMAALHDENVVLRLATALPLIEIVDWGAGDAPLHVILAHHGRPLSTGEARKYLHYWRPTETLDPVTALRPLGDIVRRWQSAAFASGGEPLPEEPRFWHAVLGYLTLADWLGSDETFFPFAHGAATDRMGWARTRAREALCSIGFEPMESRRAMSAPRFADISPYPPRPMQLAAGGLPGHLAILESDTGSGKTEAALWRFARLFSGGDVDGLYFALPTRVAAVSMYRRVVEAVARVFPVPGVRPHVTLAVPGMTHDGRSAFGEGLAARSPDITDNAQDAAAAEHWASERPKRYLAGTIAVGTIDQALLGAIQVKHAHLRAACLLRHLLVVDEVHASDAYMSRLLEHLLEFHIGAGGHALLLSATLGAKARARFLGGASSVPPDLLDAIATPYPALWSEASPAPFASSSVGRDRAIEMTLAPGIGDPQAIAVRALDAARAGAKVLVVRNLRRDAIATFESVVAQGGDGLLFSCRGIPTLHHGRYAREDRMALDAAIESAFGKTRPDGGMIAIGTQTLEISLDIDADLLITDLCPADVLLQRLGRLHRHARPRPPGFEMPRALVLAPGDLASLLARGAHGMGFFSSGGMQIAYPYPDLLALEATRRLIVEQPVWSIPAMNRILVEHATHPQAREELLTHLEPADAWRDAANGAEGRVRAFVMQAQQARLHYELPFDDDGVVFQDERFSSRLGARDLLIAFDPPVAGPFRVPITQIAIPDYWTRGIDPAGELRPIVTLREDGGLELSIQKKEFKYGRLGLINYEK